MKWDKKFDSENGELPEWQKIIVFQSSFILALGILGTWTYVLLRKPAATKPPICLIR